ncbi:Vicianin hydrolase [Frankliniella fusca]|uniref:beta-glucosidase n=1 Tax=Frankliniella fusca TaxID=407009 RepID=A0AAE1LN13_9NEOP|nr:Vicianin hydrolase [Frankliniella fusca]
MISMVKDAHVLPLAVAVVAAVALTSAAHLPANKQDESPFALPDTLLIGAGVSAFQTEGAWDADGKVESAADHLMHLGRLGPFQHGDPHLHDVAADSYHRYKEDVAMAKELGLQVYRFSISWGRVFFNGVRNEIGIKYYHNFIKEIKDSGMKPLVTLLHFDHPQAYEEAFKGWQSSQMVDKFVEYAKFAFDEYGSEVDLWVTMNEPNMFCPYFSEMYVMSGLYTREDANMYDCMRNLVLAHAKSYRAFKDAKHEGQVGINAIILHATPNSTRPEDVYAAELFNEVLAGQVLAPVVHGDFPQVLKNELKHKLTEFTEEEKQLIRGTTDFIGFNVYYSIEASYKDPAAPSPTIPIIGLFVEDLPMVSVSLAGADESDPTTFYDAITPNSLRDALLWTWESYKMPLIITENGIGDSRNVGKKDHLRASYHSAYLRALVTTMKEFNVPVRGYCAWSLIDSYEWGSGFDRPFGLVHVDYANKTLNRSLKESSEFWIELSRTRVVPLREESTTFAPTALPLSSSTPTFTFTSHSLQVSSALLCISRHFL